MSPHPAAHAWLAVYARLHNLDRAAAAEVHRAPLRACERWDWPPVAAFGRACAALEPADALRRTPGCPRPSAASLKAEARIAQEMSARGDHAGAEEELRRVLAGETRSLGADHPGTLIVRFSIAREIAARGDHTRAESEFRDLLPHLERKLGPDHPVTLILWFSIAREMAARGDHAEAKDDFQDMLPHLRRRLGPDHPDTLAAAEWIHYIQGKYTTGGARS